MSAKQQGIRWLLFILMLAVAGLGGFYAQKLMSENKTTTNNSTTVVSAPPPFSLPDTQGVIHRFEQWKGKVIVVNFWATWCPPCLREMPLFVELQKEYGDKGLQFVGIAIDTKEKVEAFQTRMDINYPLLIASTGGTALATGYGNTLGALPYTAVIDREGRIVFTQAGEITRKKAEENIIPLL